MDDCSNWIYSWSYNYDFWAGFAGACRTGGSSCLLYTSDVYKRQTLPFSEDKLLFFQYCQSSFNRHLAFMENFCQCFNCKVNEHMTIDIWPALIFLGKPCPVEQDNILKARVEYGEAAFYGPKLDFMVKDAIGRRWPVSYTHLDVYKRQPLCLPTNCSPLSRTTWRKNR